MKNTAHRNWMGAVAGALIIAAGAIAVPAGCAMDKVSALRSRAQGIEADLLVAQKRANELGPGERDAKLKQLGTLREALAAANLARENAKSLTSTAARDAVYSLTDEAYGLIEWRMGMPPGPDDARLTNLNFTVGPDGRGDAKLGGPLEPRGMNGN